MKTSEFDFFLPQKLIAERPLKNRDSSRLLVLRKDGSMDHRLFSDLPSYLNAGDMLIMNDSKVIPARLLGHKPNGAKLEILLVSEISPGLWNIMSRGKYTGRLLITDGFSAHINQGKTACFETNSNLREFLWRYGQMPLPPYIKRKPDEHDKERYQTVYADREGSIAAPTAGLHFTKELIDEIALKSVLVRKVTLHVGTGTFRLVKTENIEDHTMDHEFFEIDPLLPAEINKVRAGGNRIFAVGTTATRTIEGFMSGNCTIVESNSNIRCITNIFIREGYPLRSVDALLTNFHLPCSTPLMLASGFAGRNNLLKAYSAAIAAGYRFFSYGDAMLLL